MSSEGGERQDQIRLTGLRVVGTHGVLPEEQARAQPFEIDVALDVDLSDASASDRLEDTVDYGAVAGVVARVVADERFALLERLGGRIADVVLGLDERVSSVEITVTKLRPPVPVDLASASVRIVRKR
jgi:dihydroneopterin aldolase